MTVSQNESHGGGRNPFRILNDRLGRYAMSGSYIINEWIDTRPEKPLASLALVVHPLHARTAKPRAPCFLLKIPLELREMIYELSIHTPGQWSMPRKGLSSTPAPQIYSNFKRPWPRVHGETRRIAILWKIDHPALLLLNKQISSEAHKFTVKNKRVWLEAKINTLGNLVPENGLGVKRLDYVLQHVRHLAIRIRIGTVKRFAWKHRPAIVRAATNLATLNLCIQGQKGFVAHFESDPQLVKERVLALLAFRARQVVFRFELWWRRDDPLFGWGPGEGGCE